MKLRIPLLNAFFLMCVALAVFVITDARAQDKIRIGISSSSPGFLPTVIAEHKGFYTKYGLASEHVRISLAIAMNALGSGDLNYAITMAQGVSAAIRGVPVKLLMMTQDKLVFFLMVRPGIEQVTDLRNKAVADVIARRHGLTPGKDLHLLPSGDDQGRFASLETGRVDAVIGSTPLDVWGAKKNYKIIARAKDYTNLPQNAVIVSDTMIKQSSDQVKRMLKGTIEALQFIQTNKKESIEILASYAKTNRDMATSMFETMTDEALQAAIEEALTRAKVEKKVPVSQVANRTLLLEAQRELGLKQN
jgi:ABC-type nitrate/sulfonate/bicarbonate transport system substrate-binding protein